MKAAMSARPIRRKQLLSPSESSVVERAEHVAERHHADPRHERIDHKDDRARIPNTGTNSAGWCSRIHSLSIASGTGDPGPCQDVHADPVEGVVEHDHREAERGDGAERQVNEPGEHDHRHARSPRSPAGRPRKL